MDGSGKQKTSAGGQRRAAIPHALFERVAVHTPQLAHAVCQAVTPARAARLVRLLAEASGSTDDGRWLVGEALVVFVCGNLETQQVSGADPVVARLRDIIAPPVSTGAVTEAVYLRDMEKVLAFVHASINDDADAAMALVDAGGDKLLMLLASLISATCPVHPRPLARA